VLLLAIAILISCRKYKGKEAEENETNKGQVKEIEEKGEPLSRT